MSYSIQRVTSDGTLTDVVVGIEFMSQADIRVYVDEILADGTRDYSYTWVNSNTIRLEPTVVLGSEVLVLRATHIDAMLHNYEAGAVFNPKSMDENFTQLLYNVQEGVERTNVTDIYNDIDMHNHNIKNLAVAVNDYDAIPFKQYKDDALGAAEAAERAEEAADRAEAAANQGAGANQLYGCVATIEEPSKNVWWKGNQCVKNALYMYSTIPGQPDVVFNSDGNIVGSGGTWKPSCIWTVSDSAEWLTPTHDLYNYLSHNGVGNGYSRLAGIYNPNFGRGLVVKNEDNAGLGGEILFRRSGSISGMAILHYQNAGTGRGGLNFVGCDAQGVGYGYADFHARIDDAGNIKAQHNIYAGGDIQAFANVNTASSVIDRYSSITTLEANPAEFGLLDIVEKLAEVIIELKDRISTLEGQVNAIAPR